MTMDMTGLRDNLLEAVLPHVPEQGWHWSVVEQAARGAAMQDDFVRTIFPGGMVDVLAHFADYNDRLMMDSLKKAPKDGMRSKDKVRAAILARFGVLEPNREALRRGVAFWALPSHTIQSQRVLWRTADRIWTWAGDTATDYSRHTKRAMLSSILVGTTMVWINDESEDIMVTQAFLDRRLENAMEIGKTIGTMKQVVPNLFRQTRFYKSTE